MNREKRNDFLRFSVKFLPGAFPWSEEELWVLIESAAGNGYQTQGKRDRRQIRDTTNY